MKTLNKILLAGSLLALPLISQAQMHSAKKLKEIKSKLGAETSLDIKSLGHGYYTKNDLHMRASLNTYDAMQSGEVSYNGKKGFVSGVSSSYLSKSDLESIDDGDYIITPKEIENAIKKEYEKAFDKYAQEILKSKSENIESLSEGYKTSKDLTEKLTLLTEIAKSEFNCSPKKLYDLISKEDAVITNEEIITAANAMRNYLESKKNLPLSY